MWQTCWNRKNLIRICIFYSYLQLKISNKSKQSKKVRPKKQIEFGRIRHCDAWSAKLNRNDPELSDTCVKAASRQQPSPAGLAGCTGLEPARAGTAKLSDRLSA